MRTFLNRLTALRKVGIAGRSAEYERRTPAERRFVDESVEDRTSDAAVGEWLGGSDLQRQFDSEEHPRN